MSFSELPSFLTEPEKRLLKSTLQSKRSMQTSLGFWTVLIDWMKNWIGLWRLEVPSSSKKQHNFMEAVAHNPAFAKKAGVPQSVGKDFSAADKSKKFSKGGDMKPKIDPKMVAAMIAAKRRPAARPEMGAPAPAMAEAPMPPQAGMGGMAPTPGMKKGGTMKKMAKGGETMGPRNMSEDVEKGSNKDKKFGEHGIQKRGHTKDIEEKMSGSTTGMKRGGKAVKKMASGGMASSRADGIAQKGKTKGKFI